MAHAFPRQPIPLEDSDEVAISVATLVAESSGGTAVPTRDSTGHRGASGTGYRHTALVPEDGSTFAYCAVGRETGGLALGIVAQALTRLYAVVAMAVETMDASAVPDAIAAVKTALVRRLAGRMPLEVVPTGTAFGRYTTYRPS